AIGKAREQARLTQSQSNVKQLITAHNLYGAEWKDNQWCTNDHNLARYGNNAPNAVLNYVKAPPEGTGSEHPTIWIGWAEGGLWSFTPEPAAAKGLLEPINFNTGFGYFRTMNVQSFNGYLSGRFYDPVFYAPKDRAVIDAIGTCWDAPGAFCN